MNIILVQSRLLLRLLLKRYFNESYSSSYLLPNGIWYDFKTGKNLLVVKDMYLSLKMKIIRSLLKRYNNTFSYFR